MKKKKNKNVELVLPYRKQIFVVSDASFCPYLGIGIASYVILYKTGKILHTNTFVIPHKVEDASEAEEIALKTAICKAVLDLGHRSYCAYTDSQNAINRVLTWWNTAHDHRSKFFKSGVYHFKGHQPKPTANTPFWRKLLWENQKWCDESAYERLTEARKNHAIQKRLSPPVDFGKL